MEIGDVVYYMTDGSPWIQRTVFQGETSRSWLVGSYSWRPEKLPKNKTKFVTQQEWEEQGWVSKHRYPISKAVQNASVQQLKQIAVLIGYDESGR